MSFSLSDLPTELLRQIVEYVYEPWRLQLQYVPAYTAYSSYTIVPSIHMEQGPLLACRTLRTIAAPIIDKYFIPRLSAPEDPHQYSVFPKFKPWLFKITELEFSNMSSAASMGKIFIERLPALRTLIIRGGGYLVTDDESVSIDNLPLNAESDSANTKAEDVVILALLRIWRRRGRELDDLRTMCNSAGVDFLQTWKVFSCGLKNEYVTTYRLGKDKTRVIKHEKVTFSDEASQPD